MDMCNLDHTTANKNRKRELLGLEAELNYMVNVGYMGQWRNKNSDTSLGDKQSVSNVLYLEAPEWLVESMNQNTQTQEPGKQVTRSTGTTTSQYSAEGLKWVQEQAGLNQGEMANRLGVSRQYLNALLKGRRRISVKFSDKITEVFGDLLSTNPALVEEKPCLS